MSNYKSKPLVSVIIPTYNSEKTISMCLNSLRKQTYNNIEIIIVDNYSTDNTIKIAKTYNVKIIRYRSERAKAKNLGLRISHGKYVLFIDSDMVLTSRVIEECVTLAETDSRIAGIIIPERTVGNNFWAKVREFERSFYKGTLIESPRFFRRDIAIEAGGFDEDLIFYEEATLPVKIERLGYMVRKRIKSYILHIEYDFNLSKWLRKKHYYGLTLKKYKERYDDIVSNQVSITERLKIFVLNKYFWKNIHLSVFLIFLKTLEYLVTIL